jgi:SAM-dependent methyltransferase
MNKDIWENGVQEEITFWDYWFSSAGLQWPDDYKMRMDPDTELQEDLKELLSGIADPRILDVGAGPLTFMGKNIDRKPVTIIPIDALADQYDKMLSRHNIVPIIRTKKWDSENVADIVNQEEKFDLIVAQNTLDHSYDPLKAILAMPLCLKVDGTIYLRHYINEAERGNYNGLHQWNFYYDNGLMIRSKNETFNVNELLIEKYGQVWYDFKITETNEIIYIFKPFQ